MNYNKETVSIMCQLIIKRKHPPNRTHRYYFTILKKMFNNYFSGEYYLKNLEFLKNEPIFEHVNYKYHYYKLIYNIANDNWECLEKLLNMFDFGFEFVRPGDILACLLSIDNKSWNKDIQPNKRTLYDATGSYNRDRAINNNLSEKTKKLISRLKKKTNYESESEYSIIIDLIKEISSKEESKRLDLIESNHELLTLKKIRNQIDN